jgi:hypothetical protein
VMVPNVNLTVKEDTVLRVAGLFVTDSDIQQDAPYAVMTMSLTVVHGVLEIAARHLAAVNLLTGVAGVPSNKLVLVGSLSSVNGALGKLEYRGAPDWGGHDTLTVEASDNGHSGAGGPQTATATIFITVTSVNDPPSVQFALGGYAALEDNAVPLLGLSCHDVDIAADATVHVSVTTSGGTGTLVLRPDNPCRTAQRCRSTPRCSVHKPCFPSLFSSPRKTGTERKRCEWRLATEGESRRVRCLVRCLCIPATGLER